MLETTLVCQVQMKNSFKEGSKLEAGLRYAHIWYDLDKEGNRLSKREAIQ